MPSCLRLLRRQPTECDRVNPGMLARRRRIRNVRSFDTRREHAFLGTLSLARQPVHAILNARAGVAGLMECVVSDIPIHYDVTGHGRPLLILHGSPLDHRSVKACLEPILSVRKGWKRIYPDLPGHGRTPGMDWIANNDQMVDVLVEFIRAVLPEERFALAGESYGGYLARGVLHRLSARVDGLFLWTPATYPRASRRLPSRAVRVENGDVSKGLKSNSEKIIFGVLVVQSHKAMDFMRAHVIPGIDLADPRFVDRVTDSKFAFDVDLDRFEKPTLIICGRQDSVVGYQDAYELLSNYPMGTFVLVDGAGHALGFTEGYDLFRASIDGWLDSLEVGFQKAKS